MEVQSITKNVRMSAQKMREVVRQIQGLPALQAQAVLQVVPRKGARFVAKNPTALVMHAIMTARAPISGLAASHTARTQ